MAGRPARVVSWTNWGRTQRCAPARVVRVESEAELIEAVRSADGRVKVAGSGHSFTGIACTDGTMIRMDGYNRVIASDELAGTVTVQAGITIARLSEELAVCGLGMPNLGDIGYQTISGAIATATHGSGARFGNLSSQVKAITLVAGDGSMVECAEGEFLRAAQVNVGALGAVSTVTLQCEPAFTLHAVEEPRRLDDVLGHLDELTGGNEHFEFFWFPHTDRCLAKSLNRTAEPSRPKSKTREYVEDVLVANRAFGAVCAMGRAMPATIPRLARVVGGLLGRTEYTDRSDRVFTSPRTVRFAEMEYAVPREAAREAVLAVRSLIEDRSYRISFPVEVRFVAGDDIFLSPSYRRETCYIAVHVYKGSANEPFFRDVEAVMNGFEGRPHWGKLHFQTAETLAPRYPNFERFLEVRKRCDPGGVFRNEELDRILGVG